MSIILILHRTGSNSSNFYIKMGESNFGVDKDGVLFEVERFRGFDNLKLRFDWWIYNW